MVSLVASVHSAASFIGHPGRIYRSDSMAIIAIYISGFFVLPIVAYIMLPFYRKLDITTAYQYLERRFGLTVRLIGSALFMLQRLIWMALVVLAPSLAISVILKIRVEYCILLVGLIASIYTALGGMSAVMWTDVIQFMVLIVGEAMIFIVVSAKLDGGFMEIIRVAVEDNKIWGSFEWNIAKPTFWTLLIHGCVMGFVWGTDQLQVQRLMTSKDEKAAKTSLLSLLVLNVPRYAVLVLMGLSLYAFYTAFPQMLSQEIAETPDKLLPYFVMTQIPVGLSGLVIAAIFAAAMSSFDSGLNCIVAAVTVDWYERLFNRGQDDKRYLAFAKILTVILGVAIMILSVLIYRAGLKSLIDTSNKYIGFFFGPIVGIFMLGIFTRRAKEIPTLIAALISIATLTVINIINSHRPGDHIINSYFYGPLAVAITMILGYVGSLFGLELPYEKIKGFTLAKKK